MTSSDGRKYTLVRGDVPLLALWPLSDSPSSHLRPLLKPLTCLLRVRQERDRRKRQIAVDILGLPVMTTVTPTEPTFRDAVRELLWDLRGMQLQVMQACADFAWASHLVSVSQAPLTRAWWSHLGGSITHRHSEIPAHQPSSIASSSVANQAVTPPPSAGISLPTRAGLNVSSFSPRLTETVSILNLGFCVPRTVCTLA